MQQILIDVGNSSIKWCAATQHLGAVTRVPRSPEQLAQSLTACGAMGPVWISSVAGEDFDHQVVEALQAAGYSAVQRLESPAESHGLHNSYEQPQRMGVDRWLAMLAAWCEQPDALAVVDVGTALTVDLVSDAGQHEGGYIIPGTRLMADALLRDTQRVRFNEQVAPSLAPGTHTGACVSAGIWMALYGSVQQVLLRYPSHRVVVTGGDGEALLRLGINGEWRPHLVLEGLAVTASSQ